MLFAVSLAVAAAASAVTASPVGPRAKTTVLSLKHVSNVSSVKNIVQKGQSRIENINGKHTAARVNVRASSGSVTNEDVTYVAPVVIGGKTWDLIVDTGCKLLLSKSPMPQYAY